MGIAITTGLSRRRKTCLFLQLPDLAAEKVIDNAFPIQPTIFNLNLQSAIATMYSRYQIARKYLHYYLTAANGKGHGIHSPFVYDFVRNVLNDKRNFYAYKE